MNLRNLLFLLLPASLASAAEVTLSVPAIANLLPNPHALPAATHATLTTLSARRPHDAPLTAANTFVFRNVTPGSYLADVHCATHAFAPLRVDVVPTFGRDGAAGENVDVRAWETFRGNDWNNRGEEVRLLRSGAAAAAFPVKVLGPKNYYMERGSFSLLGILKNPMILMGLASMGLFIGMPKLLENMDAETRAEFEEQQKNNPMGNLMSGGGGGGANPMGSFDMAAFLAGQKKDEGGQSSGNGGQKGGRR
ncbi:hypothetical protein F4780DRAFT_224868 [Xylariomycetidae sp. FL0641]|nr:hypothetical protein F4780DRAFT_224868 [Xylariomycetidae sp. FL0641]